MLSVAWMIPGCLRVGRVIVVVSGLIVSMSVVQADSRLTNMSTRGQVGTADNVLIGGLIIPGTSGKTVVVRAIAPSIDPSLVAAEDQLADPTLRIVDANGTTVATNDNWQSDPNVGAVPAHLLPGDPNESAIVVSLAAGAYTAIVSGVAGGTGVALVEVFEVNASDPDRLANISTRGVAGTGDNVLIGGLIIEGDSQLTVAIRAIGPSISAEFVPEEDQLQDPQLRLFSGSTEIGFNNNWQDAANAGEIPAHLQPTDALESVLLVTLDPGGYTAIVSGTGGTTGVGLVEVFEVSSESAVTAETFFNENVSAAIIQGVCINCHVPGGPAGLTGLRYVPATTAGHMATNLATLRNFVGADSARADLILSKARGVGHGGGAQLPVGSGNYSTLESFINLLKAEL